MGNKIRDISTIRANLRRTLLKNVLETSIEAALDHLDRTGFFDATEKHSGVAKSKTQAPAQTSRITRNIVKQPEGKKLTEQDALDIYNEDRLDLRELADLYGVSITTVYQIKHGMTWWRVTGATPNPQKRYKHG